MSVHLVAVCIGVASLSTVGSRGGARSEAPDECFALGDNGVPVTCTYVEGERVATDTEGLGPAVSDDHGGGPPGGFAVGVLAVVSAVGFAVWRIVLARNMARRAGMDENEATAMTFLSENGLAATYVALISDRNPRRLRPRLHRLRPGLRRQALRPGNRADGRAIRRPRRRGHRNFRRVGD